MADEQIESTATETIEQTAEPIQESGATPGTGEPVEEIVDPTGDSSATEVKTEDPEKHPNALQKRIDKMHREKMEERERRERAEAELNYLKQSQQQPKLEPQGEDETVEGYLRKEMLRMRAEEDQRRATIEAKESFNKRIADGKKEIPDYDEVTAGIEKMPFSPHVNAAAIASKNPAAFGYYLMKNPAELERLNSIQNPVQALLEIGRLERTIEETLKPKKISSAPPPIKPISRGNGGMASVDEFTESAQQRLDRIRRERIAKG